MFALARSTAMVCRVIFSSIVDVSSLTNSSPGLTIVPVSITHSTVLPPLTKHLISLLLELSTVPFSVTVTARSPRRIVCIKRGSVSPGVSEADR